MSELDHALSAPALPAHLYIHVPFCASKCDYCDFASVAGASPHVVNAVFAAIRTELIAWERSGLEGVFDTIYFGGGTPTLVAEKVVDLLGFVKRTFVIHPAAEITVEANPDSLTPAVAALLAEAGVTRVSVGVQSFSDSDLRVLGRRHDAEAALRACGAVVSAGMDLSIDLICAVPGQSRTSWGETLSRVGRTGARHVSVYPLAIEEGTPMCVAVDAGLLAEPGEDIAAEHMMLAEEALAVQDFERYEVANYAIDSAHHSRHNTAYWTGRDYIGIGPGAHGMLGGAVAGAIGIAGRVAAAEYADADDRVRYSGSPDIEQWLMGQGVSVEVLSHQEALREDAMLGLRLTEGITESLAQAAGVSDALESLARDGLAEQRDGRWRTTRRGWLLGNEVFGRIWQP